MKDFNASKLIILVSVFIILFGNIAFFSNVTNVYPLSAKNILFLFSLAVVFSCAIIFLLSLFCYKYTLKPVLILILMISASASYYMDTFNVVINDDMIDNIFQTNIDEASDLITLKFILYLLFLGIVPSIFIYKLKISYKPAINEFISRLKLFSLSFTVIIAVVLIFGNYYASFFREHKSLRFYANPSYYLYSIGKYIGRSIKSENVPLKKIALDVIIPSTDTHRELVIFVVGETARADRFSLNGYKKETNPYLKKENVISFKHVSSCGTSTSYSVPCMFSIYDRDSYEKSKANNTENVLDVIKRAGGNVIWLDNNSDSKGVATRIEYINYRIPENNTICDIECRDEGMLVNLQSYIDNHPKGDIFIVLHQMGNHGPAYYKRYPAKFEKFKPSCKTNQLENCTEEEVNNSYDNAILYTDYFLSKTINLLKDNNDKFESSLIYMSDHGESLGEKGLYLHGLPYFIAPKEQTHIPAIMWFSQSFDLDIELLKTKVNNEYSHDNLFHTILGLLEIETGVYIKELDIINHKDND